MARGVPAAGWLVMVSGGAGVGGTLVGGLFRVVGLRLVAAFGETFIAGVLLPWKGWEEAGGVFLGVGLRFATVDGNICLGVIAAVQFVVVERIVKVGRVERYRGCEVCWAVRLVGLRGCEVKRL